MGEVVERIVVSLIAIVELGQEVIKVGFEAHINKHEEMKHICFLMDWFDY